MVLVFIRSLDSVIYFKFLIVKYMVISVIILGFIKSLVILVVL